jgi:hypothetical protein
MDYMTNNANLIKTALEHELIKAGKSLQDLENYLSNKTAGIDAYASKATSAFGSLLNAGGALGLGLGMGAGTLGYGAYLANEDSTRQQQKKMREKLQYLEAAKRIRDNIENPVSL